MKSLAKVLEHTPPKIALTEDTIAEAILATIDEGVFAVDWDGRIVAINRAALRMTGYEESEVVGRYTNELLLFSDESGNLLFEHGCPILVAFSEDRDIVLASSFLEISGGRKLEVASRHASVRGEQGAPFAGLVTFRDITEARALDHAKDEFISVASHELRTPVSAVRGYVSMLLDPRIRLDEAKAQEILQAISENSERLSLLINDLLAVSRLESKKMNFHLEPLDLQVEIEKALAEVRPLAAVRQITLQQEVGEAKCFADRVRLREILSNFLSNAIKFTPEKGRVTIATAQKSATVSISVADTGIGIAPENLSKIFERFYRIDNSFTREAQGTGLGLYLCRELAERMNGSIAVSSEPEHGSVFTVTLPREVQV